MLRPEKTHIAIATETAKGHTVATAGNRGRSTTASSWLWNWRWGLRRGGNSLVAAWNRNRCRSGLGDLWGAVGGGWRIGDGAELDSGLLATWGPVGDGDGALAVMVIGTIYDGRDSWRRSGVWRDLAILLTLTSRSYGHGWRRSGRFLRSCCRVG
jgi:hypothetical protein